ncbi:MAG: hypothetical protein ACLP1X_01245 [Polyangiaceae bacterium]|jgi:hypothetical protein
MKGVRRRRFLSAVRRGALAATVVVAGLGCGLGLGGVSGVGHEGGVLSETGDATTSFGEGGGSGGGSSGGTIPPGSDGGSSIRDADGNGDASDAIDAEVMPSQGSIGCPENGDAAAPCDLSSNVCCTCPNCFAPYPTQCFPTVTGCVGVVFSGIYAPLACENQMNCAAGSVCCASFNSSTLLTGSSCKPSCAAGDVQLCTVNTECGASRTCQSLTSIPGFNGCQ